MKVQNLSIQIQTRAFLLDESGKGKILHNQLPQSYSERVVWSRNWLNQYPAFAILMTDELLALTAQAVQDDSRFNDEQDLIGKRYARTASHLVERDRLVTLLDACAQDCDDRPGRIYTG